MSMRYASASRYRVVQAWANSWLSRTTSVSRCCADHLNSPTMPAKRLKYTAQSLPATGGLLGNLSTSGVETAGCQLPVLQVLTLGGGLSTYPTILQCNLST